MVKTYDNHSHFEAHGKSRLQISTALRDVVWDEDKSEVKTGCEEALEGYLITYQGYIKGDDAKLKEEALGLLEDVSLNEGKNSNAFYYVYSKLNKHNQKAIFLSFVFCFIGLVFVAIIAIQNICYVLYTAGLTRKISGFCAPLL